MRLPAFRIDGEKGCKEEGRDQRGKENSGKLEREESEGKGGISFSISGAAKRLKTLKTAFSRGKVSGPI